MGATRKQIIAQYNRAKSLAWTEHFREAANTITAGYFDTADLMAIGSRETNLDPKWLTKKGDNGHGAGLMQIDDRSFPAFTQGDNWKSARLGILYGAKVLMQKWNDLQKNAGKTLTVKSYKFKGPHVSGITAQQIVIAAYNSGRWAAYHYTKGRHPDYGTTGKDYSADVMARARIFRELLGKDGMLDKPHSTTTPAATEPASPVPGANALVRNEQASATTPEPSSTIPEPIIPTPTEAVPVQVVSMPPDPTPTPPAQEDTLTKIGNRFAGIWTAAGAAIVGAGTFLTSTPQGIAIAIIGSVALVGVGYMIVNAWRASSKEKRDAEERKAREDRDLAARIERDRWNHEIQKMMIEAARNKDMNSVVLTPPPIEMPTAENQGEVS